MSGAAAEPLLRAERLSKSYRVRSGLFGHKRFPALSEVGLEIAPGEVVGLVGESGSGKTTFARIVMGMIRPDAGRVLFDGADLARLDARALRPLRRELAIVYQNPYQSLNPRLSARDLVAEPIITHEADRGAALTRRVGALLEQVGLDASHLHRRVAELSGGQAQRIAIARAIALKPKLVILDEPTSALDVSVQAQILNLLTDLRRATGAAYLFISHNLDVVRYLADRVAVMERGRIVETGPAERVLDAPEHPCTQALIAASLSSALES